MELLLHWSIDDRNGIGIRWIFSDKNNVTFLSELLSGSSTVTPRANSLLKSEY